LRPSCLIDAVSDFQVERIECARMFERAHCELPVLQAGVP
jgi:hypothetical protein